MIRHLARAMMAGIFIYGGVDALRNPASKVQAAEDAADALPDDVPFPPTDDAETLRAAGVAAVYTPKDFEVSRLIAEMAELVKAR